MSSFDCRIYITFHKILPLKSYENVDRKWLEKYCRFVAANVDIEKIIPEELASLVIWEKERKQNRRLLMNAFRAYATVENNGNVVRRCSKSIFL